MVGEALRAFGSNLGFLEREGVLYGIRDGFMTTLDEGPGYKELYVSVCILDPEAVKLVEQAANSLETKGLYHMQIAEVTDRFIAVRFFDAPNILERLQAFMDWFYDILRSHGVQGVLYCPVCKQPFTEYKSYKLIDGKAYVIHEHCGPALLQQWKAEDPVLEKPNYGRGALGAVLGGMVGAIPWAIAYVLGFFVGWLGFLIGIAAQKGYTLLGGKIRKPTVFILAVSVILGVLFGQLLGDCFEIGKYILAGDAYGATLADIPHFLIKLFENPDYVSSFLVNSVIGLVFAALGVFSLFRQILKSAPQSKVKMINL